MPATAGAMEAKVRSSNGAHPKVQGNKEENQAAKEEEGAPKEERTKEKVRKEKAKREKARKVARTRNT